MLKRILIAEDESIIAKDIARTLEKLGYKVEGMERTGSGIIAKAADVMPDLILMDINLEGKITGIEAAQEIMLKFNIPVIYLTAFADSDTLNKAKITEPFGYILKPYDERTLHSSIEMALYKHEISVKLRERTEELRKEKERSELLLQNILPLSIIKELKEEGLIKPREYKSVTLLFTDFEGFTSLSSMMPPHELVNELNEIFQNFDSIISKYNLEKLKTIGDSYMAGAGFPVICEDHAVRVVSAAVEMQRYIEDRNISSKYKWRMRAGIHSGNIIAGVVGKNKYTYDVWGDTVNIASRMERFSNPGKINITGNTKELIKEHFNCSLHDKVEIPGNGTISMFFVTGVKDGNVDAVKRETSAAM